MKGKPLSSPLMNTCVAYIQPQLAPLWVIKKSDKWNIVDQYKQRNIFGHESILYVLQNEKDGKIKSTVIEASDY